MRQPCELEKGTHEEIELKPMKQKENILHDELIQLLDGDESDRGDLQAKSGMDSEFTSTSVQTDTFTDACDFLPKDETIPSYIEEFEKDAQDDIIVLGSLSQKQDFRCQEDYFQTGRKLFYRRSNHTFNKTESQLLNAANAHKEKILAKLGNISEVNNESNGAAGLCWKSGWSGRPQPIEIILKCLRGVKDKIPMGHYVLKTSLLSRPGGHALHWSKVKDHLWAETTLPVYHKGRFYDVEMTVNHAVHTLLPTEKKIKSGMTLLLELYLLHGKDTYIDRAVGWGIFPLCDNNLNVLEGKFRCPFLRGHYDFRIDRFTKIEDLIMADLDNWLCNLYFQVVKLPLCTNKQQDYDTFVQLPQEFLTYSNHDDKDIDTEEDMQPSRQKDCKKSYHSQNAPSLFFTYSHGQPLASQKDPNVHKEFVPSTMSGMETQLNAMKGKEKNIRKESKLQQTSLTQILQVEETSEESTSTVKHIRRKICKKGVPRNKIIPYMDKQSSALTSKEDFDLDEKKKEKDLPEKHFQWMPKIETSEDKKIDKCSTSTSYLDELEKHRFSVWFTFYPHTVELTYQHSLMHTREELFMVVVGPMSLNVSMLLMILLRWSCQILFRSFPTILSKFIIALGLWTVLDPLAVFIVDAFLGRLSYDVKKPIADAAKLYWFFIRIEQSGTPGILITLLIYTMILIISSSVLYLYLLRIHKESWILDVFQRITCDDGVCHVPYDLEISNQELSHIVRKAEQWRGISGERRKVTVYDYIWKKETSKTLSTSDIQHLEHYSSKGDEDSSKDITAHVMIYTIHLRGYKHLYRQFLRLPNGAIVEIFGDFSGINLLPSGVNPAVEDHANQIYSPMCDTPAVDLRERKKSTADN